MENDKKSIVEVYVIEKGPQYFMISLNDEKYLHDYVFEREFTRSDISKILHDMVATMPSENMVSIENFGQVLREWPLYSSDRRHICTVKLVEKEIERCSDESVTSI